MKENIILAARGQKGALAVAQTLFEIKVDNFIDDCISSGSVSSLPHHTILAIEDVLNRFNDKTAKTKIRKILQS